MIRVEASSHERTFLNGPFTEVSKIKASLATFFPDIEFQASREGFTIDTDVLINFLALVEIEDFDLEIPNPMLAAIEDRKIQVHAVTNFQLTEVNSDAIGVWSDILMPHQAEAVAKLTLPGLPGAALFDEQGVGKTLTTLAAFDLLYQSSAIERLFVISPAGGFKAWTDDIEKFLPRSYSYEIIEGRKGAPAISGSSQVIIASFESVISLLPNFLLAASSRKTLLVVDESFFVKNADAKRTQALHRLRPRIEKCFVLCGTPTPQNALDIVSQINLADGGVAFAGFSASGVRDTDFAEITRRSERAPIIRRTKEQVLPNLPKKIFSIIESELSAVQQVLYDEIVSELVLYLQKVDRSSFERDVQTYLQKRVALTQVSISPSLLGAASNESGKYAKLQEVVENHLETSDRSIIIWSSYRRAIDDVAFLFRAHSPLILDGRVSGATEKSEIVDSFQSMKDHRIMIANPKSASTSLTLTAANRSIYLDIPWQAAYLMQSIDRIHRPGQTSENVFIDFLLSKDTVDVKDYSRAKMKIDSQALLLGDTTPTFFSYEDALAELEVHLDAK